MFQWFGKVNFVPYTRVSDFARHLKDGRIMGSRCKACGEKSFPPRADCGACLSGDFEFFEGACNPLVSVEPLSWGRTKGRFRNSE